MTNELRQVSRNAKWAIAQTVISAGVLFFLYRFLLHELGAAKLGLWSLILASTTLAKIGELGFSNATLRFVGRYVGAGQPQEAAEILETALLSISLPFLILAALAVPLIGLILPWFVPAEHMPEALVIVPWAMLALWLGVTGGLVQSAIDGSGRMDQRSMVLIATNLLYLAGTVVLVPVLGLRGVAIAQALQAGVALALMWWLARRRLKALPWLPVRWRKNRFTEIAGFALTMQAGSVAGMFMEPITKALISRFGGLEFLAYYDMANQVVSRARSVLISGFQAITPEFAIARDEAEHRKLFLQSQRKVIDMGMPFMALVMLAFPVLSVLWIGHSEPAFIISGQILGLTCMAVTFLMPSYFFLTGTGRGLPVAIAQSASLAGTALLGWAAAQLHPQFGPIVGAALALLLGNIYMYVVTASQLFQSKGGHPFPQWIGRRSAATVCVCLAVVGLNLLGAQQADSLWKKISMSALLGMGIALFALRNRRTVLTD